MCWLGTAALSSFLTAGAGGGAAAGIWPRRLLSAPVKPWPPSTLETFDEGGGSSLSTMTAIWLGTSLGASSLPASNWGGMTLTTLGASGGGRGGGGGGGGGATRKLVKVPLGSASK